MPFDLNPDEKILIWRQQADHYRALAVDAETSDGRAAYLRIAESYDRLVASEERILHLRRRGIMSFYGA